MKCVILAGGLGTRLREETEYKPKPMVEIGGKPILLHIIENFLFHGIDEFIIATGYKGEVINNYFNNFESFNYNSTYQIKNGLKSIDILDDKTIKNLKVSVVNTGLDTMTGGRLFRLKNYLESEDFICTYGDGLSNVNIKTLIKFHKNHNRIATITAVKPISRFGILNIDSNASVVEFREKPQMTEWINGGFFVFKPEIFSYLSENSVLEAEPLVRLTQDFQLSAYKHAGFWQPMDTYREYLELNDLYKDGNAPWKVF